MPAGGRETNRMRSALVDAGGWEPWCTPGGGGGGGGWEPWGTAGGGIENGSSSSSAMVHNLTVADEDVDVLECGICYHPLKPPIFQCAKGHVVCSQCYESLKDTVRCQVCRVAMPGGYQQCHAMERVVDSIRGPCPHAPYGCDARPVYHAREEHIRQCPHAPCCCPGIGCGFVGSVTTLVVHLAAAHGWRCTAEPSAEDSFGVDLHDGFNFLTAVRGGSGTKYLLLLDMATTPFFHVISVVWIRSVPAIASNSSAPATVNTTCDLELRFRQFKRGDYQRSRFQLQCTTPLNCLPDPNASFHQFFLPKYLGGPYYKATVHVTAKIFIDSS